jgi:ribosomal protein RSM22 (predicted rRNA methylase)
VVVPSLPAELRTALEARLEGLSRSDVAARADRISKTYREGGGSGVIASETDALAYALARMPATYAAAAASLNALLEARPEFAPGTLLDIGAGPGTASFAAAEAFPSLTALSLLDENSALRALALRLVQDHPRLAQSRYVQGEARRLVAAAESADLVIASYMIGELTDAERTELAALM